MTDDYYGLFHLHIVNFAILYQYLNWTLILTADFSVYLI
jgi:hypothetical protein